MAIFSIYDSTSGQVTKTVICTPGGEDTEFDASYEGVLIGALDEDTEYVDVSTLLPIPRPEFPISIPADLTVVADGVDTVSISGIPAGTIVTVSEPGRLIFTVDGGVVEFTFDSPSRYGIKFELFPYKNTEVSIDAS